MAYVERIIWRKSQTKHSGIVKNTWISKMNGIVQLDNDIKHDVRKRNMIITVIQLIRNKRNSIQGKLLSLMIR